MDNEGFDDLHICRICGERCTTSDICNVCQQQHAIDMEGIRVDPDRSPCMCCGRKYEEGTGEWSVFGHWFCNQCLD